jgi:hypothetical protein
LLTLHRLGVPPDRALYVGDRPEVDGVTATSAGVAAVIVGRSRAGAGTPGVSHVGDYATLETRLFGPAAASRDVGAGRGNGIGVTPGRGPRICITAEVVSPDPARPATAGSDAVPRRRDWTDRHLHDPPDDDDR